MTYNFHRSKRRREEVRTIKEKKKKEIKMFQGKTFYISRLERKLFIVDERTKRTGAVSGSEDQAIGANYSH